MSNNFFVSLVENKKYLTNFLNKNSLEKNQIDYLNKKGILEYDNLLENVVIFRFVGLIILDNINLFIFPKISKDKKDLDFAKVILNVLKKYGKNVSNEVNSDDFLSYDLGSEKINDLYTADFLLNDYIENGLFSKTISNLDMDNTDEIDWLTTVENVQPIFSNNRPIYTNTYNFSNINIIDSEISFLHSWIINHLNKKFGYILDISIDELETHFSDEIVFSQKEYFISLVYSEINRVFDDRSINLLNSILNFLKKVPSNSYVKYNIFGTKYFEIIWEKCCSFVFGNEYDRYSSLMPKPIWNDREENSDKKNTLRPDIVKIHKNDNETNLLILDAKYYDIDVLSGRFINNPGVEDVTKQFLYQISLEKHLKPNHTHNAFIFPSENVELFGIFGNVFIDLFEGKKPIILIYFSQRLIYEKYIKNEVFTEFFFLKFIEETKKFYHEIGDENL